ncbi:hypothetical protein [Enterobacter cloacae]|nr:hypothetical protein [Enterobacter cloacae]
MAEVKPVLDLDFDTSAPSPDIIPVSATATKKPSTANPYSTGAA